MTASYVISTDVTYGKYLSSLTVAGKTWTFDPAYSVLLRVYDTGTEIETEYDLSDFTFVSSATAGATTTLTYDGAGALTGITLKLLFHEEDASVGLQYQITACPASLAIMWVRFPNTVVEPYGTLGDQRGVLSTTSIPSPQTVASAAVNATAPAMQYAGLFDVASNVCLMLWVDDDEGNCTRIQVVGATTATRFYVEHNADRRYDGGGLFAKTYKVHLEVFTGLSSRGEMCAEDFADRYREWATDSARPWMSRGRWRDSSDVSNRIKLKAFVYTAQDDLDWTRHQISMSRLSTYFGVPSAILLRWMFSDNLFVTPPDPATPTIDSTYESEMHTLQDRGIDTSAYVYMRVWDSTLVGDYDPTSFNGRDITTLFEHEKDGTLKEATGNLYLFDFTEADTPDVIVELSDGYYALHTSEKPHGTYIDVHTGIYHDFAGGGIGVEQEDDPAETTWTFADHQAGVLASIQAVKAARRATDPHHIIGGEFIEPNNVLSCDLVGLSRIDGDVAEAGNDTGAGSYVYGEYVRITSLVGPGLFGTGIVSGGLTQSSFIYSTIQNITHYWLQTGIVSVAARAIYDFVAADVENGNFYGPMWKWAKKLVTLALGEALDYFSGRRMRSLGDDFATELLETAGLIEAKIITVGWEFPIQTGVWKADDGRLGILIAHTYQSGMTSPGGTPTAGARTVTVALTRTRYDLDSGSKVIVQNDNGALTLLAAWTDETISLDVEVQEGTVTLLEVLDDTESSAFGSSPVSTRGRRLNPDFKEDRRYKGLSGTHKGLGTRGGPPYFH